MSHGTLYQVALIEPGSQGLSGILSRTLRRRIKELGLDARKSFRFLDHRLLGFDRDAPLVGIYFGGDIQRPVTTRAAAELVRRSAFLLPVVPALKSYARQVPAALHLINGAEFDAADPHLEGVAAYVLEALVLLRARRRVFISYRRDRSSRVAEQLHHELDARSFDVFLDTRSVPRGELFQSVLWDRMSDTDLVVLLDAPGTLDSTWVAKELAQAHRAGLGVLQLIWPGHSRARGTEFCIPEYLEGSDFRRGLPLRAGGLPLRKNVLRRIATVAESLRARSQAARRIRLVNEFCNQAGHKGLSTLVQPAQHIDVMKGQRKVRVFPVVGHPDSIRVHEVFDQCRRPPVDAVLLYDPDGMQERRVRHLGWLNQHLPRAVRMLPTTEIYKWAGVP